MSMMRSFITDMPPMLVGVMVLGVISWVVYLLTNPIQLLFLLGLLALGFLVGHVVKFVNERVSVPTSTPQGE